MFPLMLREKCISVSRDFDYTLVDTMNPIEKYMMIYRELILKWLVFIFLKNKHNDGHIYLYFE